MGYYYISLWPLAAPEPSYGTVSFCQISNKAKPSCLHSWNLGIHFSFFCFLCDFRLLLTLYPTPTPFNWKPKQAASPLENHREQMLLFLRHGNNSTGEPVSCLCSFDGARAEPGPSPDHLTWHQLLCSSAQYNTGYQCKACACVGMAGSGSSMAFLPFLIGQSGEL